MISKYNFNDFNLIFNENSILIDGRAAHPVVMADFEKPLMKRHADIVCQLGGDILEIGFGMGISANYIQSNNIKSHTIVEIHPQILERLYQWSKNKSNVRVIEGDWFDNRELICSMKYDGIFFDTHLDWNIFQFREVVVDKCLKDSGIFTWFSPNYPLYEGVDHTFGYSNVNVESIDLGFTNFKLPYIFSNHQLK